MLAIIAPLRKGEDSEGAPTEVEATVRLSCLNLDSEVLAIRGMLEEALLTLEGHSLSSTVAGLTLLSMKNGCIATQLSFAASYDLIARRVLLQSDHEIELTLHEEQLRQLLGSPAQSAPFRAEVAVGEVRKQMTFQGSGWALLDGRVFRLDPASMRIRDGTTEILEAGGWHPLLVGD